MKVILGSIKIAMLRMAVISRNIPQHLVVAWGKQTFHSDDSGSDSQAIAMPDLAMERLGGYVNWEAARDTALGGSSAVGVTPENQI